MKKKFIIKKAQTGGTPDVDPELQFGFGETIGPLSQYEAERANKALIQGYKDRGAKYSFGRDDQGDAQLNFEPNMFNKIKAGTNEFLGEFNKAALLTTGVAGAISDNKLKDQEETDILKRRGSKFFENKDSQGLNNIPAYTKYGGTGKMAITDDMMDGLMNSYIYGNTSLYQAGGDVREGGVNQDEKQASATIAYYKEILNNKLRETNPKEFDTFIQGWAKTPFKERGKFVEGSTFEPSLTPEQVVKTLGKEDAKVYYDALKNLRDYQKRTTGKVSFAGDKENVEDLEKLNYGKRFATLMLNPKLEETIDRDGKRYTNTKEYVFDPKTRTVNFTEDSIPVKFQAGGVNKYARKDWGESLDYTTDLDKDKKMRDIIYNISKQTGLKPELLFSTVMEEGAERYRSSKDKRFNVGQGAKNTGEGDLDAYAVLGMDDVDSWVNKANKKGYINRDIDYYENKQANEQGRQVNSAYFNNLEDALTVKAGMFKTAYDDVDAQLKKHGLDPTKVTQDEKDFYALQVYNGGAGILDKAIPKYQKQGILEGGKFLTTEPGSAEDNPAYYSARKKYDSAKYLLSKGAFDDYYAQPETAAVPLATPPAAVGSSLAAKQAGGTPEIQEGLPDEMAQFASVEAEEGEIIENTNGSYYKIADDAGTHEEGGVKVPNVERVLEDTSDKRKDKASKELLIPTEEFEKLFGFKPKKGVSHSKAFEMANEHYDKQRKKVQDAQKITADKQELDVYAAKAAKLNFRTLANIPSSGDVFDALFLHQETIKQMSGIQDDGSMKKCMGGSKYKTQAGGAPEPTPTVDEKTYKKARDTYFALMTKEGKNVPLSKDDLRLKMEADKLMSENAKFYESTLGHIGQNVKDVAYQAGNRIRNTFNQAMGTHYQAGGDVPKAQYGAFDPTGIQPLPTYPGGQTEAGKTMPSGKTNEFGYSGGLNDLIKQWGDAGFDFAGVKSVNDFQAKTYDYLLQTPEGKNVLRAMWESGNTDKGLDEGILKDKYPTGKFSGKALSDEELTQLKSAYVDGMLGARTIAPSVLKNPGTAAAPAAPKAPADPLDTSAKGNLNFIQKPKNKFFEPTYWNDLAPATLSLLDSMTRTPELYNSMEFNQLKYKLLDPTEALNANQADFNAVLDDINVSTGTGAANAANLLAKKYQANAQVISQFENQNAAIKNQEIGYNTQVKDRQSMADAQTRAKYYRDVQMSRENQRQQRLKAVEDISRVVSMKRRQNNSGNLLLKMSPAFDQFGEYNGLQTMATLPTELGAGQQVEAQGQTTPGSQEVYMTLSNGQKIRFK